MGLYLCTQNLLELKESMAVSCGPDVGYKREGKTERECGIILGSVYVVSLKEKTDLNKKNPKVWGMPRG